MAKRAGHFYYKILRRFMQDSNNGHIHPIFTTFVKKHGLNRPALGKIVVRFLCLHRNVDTALGLIHEFNQNDLKINFPDDVIKILKEHGRSVDAFKLLMMAKTDLSMVDVVDYSILVDGLCKEGYVEKAVQLCRFARNRGVSLNVVTYNSLFNGLCREGCLVEAFRLFDALEKNNVFPSEITYGTLIDALVRERFLLDARELFERMLVENIKPTTRIYNSLIDGYCKFGQLKEALRLLSDMESDSLKPDEFTVSAVIYGFSLKGNVEGALQFFTNMSENGFRPDFLGYLYLVRGLCTKGRMEEARSVLREMLRDQSVIELINRINVEVEMESVESFLCELCERGSIQEALVVLNEIGAMFFPYKRNTTPQEQIPTVCQEEEDICHPVNSSSTSYEMDFDTIYERMASLCFEGDAKGVPNFTKE